MEIIRGCAGYCKGVELAVKKADEVIEKAFAASLPAYCIGDLVHNNATRQTFAQKGMSFIRDACVPPGYALVSAHGIEKDLRDRFSEKGFVLTDGTCPKIVRNLRKIIEKAAEGYEIAVIGIPGHSETKCLCSYIPGTRVLSCPEDVLALDPQAKLYVIAQTTVSPRQFSELSAMVKDCVKNAAIEDTMCDAVRRRQSEAQRLGLTCSAVIIVGSKDSSNSEVLSRTASSGGAKVLFIDKADELEPWVFDEPKIGVMSGTSTSIGDVEEVVRALSNNTGK